MQPKQLVVASHPDGWFPFLAFSPVKLHLPLQCLRRWHNVRHCGFPCSSGNIEKFPFWEMSCRGPVHRGTVYLSSGKFPSGKCPVGAMSGRGIVVLSGTCPSGNYRRGTVYRGSVRRGSVPSGKCPRTINFHAGVINMWICSKVTAIKLGKLTNHLLLFFLISFIAVYFLKILISMEVIDSFIFSYSVLANISSRDLKTDIANSYKI